MHKYIIKNCPAYDDGDCASPTVHVPYATACEHIPDCLVKKTIQGNEKLKEENKKWVHKNLEKQYKINELLNIISVKEFTLNVNGKKYEKLNGIDKAKLFINNENAIRDKYIKELENDISALQWKFYDNCKATVNANIERDKYKKTLEEIREEIDNCQYGDCVECKYKMTDDCRTRVFIDLRTKINEVLQ